MPRMTEEEAWALEEEVTRNPPRVTGAGNGFFVKNRDHVILVDDFSADWLRIKAAADHTTPEAIIASMVRERIAQSA